jgi:hypothetical protein
MGKRVATLVLAALVVMPAAAGADEGLEDYLQSAMDAEFHGSGVVMCTWGADSAATTYEVTRSDGMSMVQGPDGGLMLSGPLTASAAGADWYALEVSEWSAWSLSDRYSLGETAATSRLGRSATEVMVMEDGRARARLVIDDESTVPLLTEVFGADGGVFRFAVLVDFVAAPTVDMEMPDSFMEHEMLMLGDPSSLLPDSAFGYRRTDTYALDGRGSQAFYSDGLFSFSVFEVGRGAVPAEFADGSVFEVEGEAYTRIITPSNVWVHWRSPDRSYVLVGDLPPDHIEAVLPQLPRPGTRGVIMRWLSRLFG